MPIRYLRKLITKLRTQLGQYYHEQPNNVIIEPVNILMEIQKENTDLRRVLTEKRVHIKKLATEKMELLESTTPCRNTRSCFKHRELCVKEVSWASHIEMRLPCEQDFDH
jgi:hypothetical protein